MGASRALVVEDDPSLRTRIAMFLLDSNVRAVCASSVADGMKELLEKGPFDLIVTDYVLPDGFGDKIVMAARRLYPESRIVCMSSARREYVLPFVSRAGCSVFLQKPLWDDLQKILSDE